MATRFYTGQRLQGLVTLGVTGYARCFFDSPLSGILVDLWGFGISEWPVPHESERRAPRLKQPSVPVTVGEGR